MQDKLSKLFRNRGGAVIAGGIAALVAILLLIVYLHSYRSSVNSGKQPVRVLVATKLIPRGTSGDSIAKETLYQATTVQKDQIEPLAISDPSAIAGRVAAGDIYPGQQLTQGDFTTENATSIPYEISGKQRAIAIPVDSAHGLVGQVANGDFVDVYIGTTSNSAPLLTLLAPDVQVLVAPGTTSSNAILRVTTDQAPKFAYAADNARIWLILRPQVGASQTPPVHVTLASILGSQG